MITIIAASLRLGYIGILGVLIMIIVFVLPMFVILNKLDFSFAEKIVFSIFLGLGVISSLAYYIGLIIRFRLAIILSVILVIIVGTFIVRFLPKKQSEEQN